MSTISALECRVNHYHGMVDVCRKNCSNSGCRSILIGASGGGGGTSYFQRVAVELGVEFTSPSWARCLVAAMTISPKEELSPSPFLDELNKGR